MEHWCNVAYFGTCQVDQPPSHQSVIYLFGKNIAHNAHLCLLHQSLCSPWVKWRARW